MMYLDKQQAPTIEIGEMDFEEEVLMSKQPVLVMFGAPWSQPCHVLETVLDEVAEVWTGRVKLVRVNADDNPDLSLWYGIQSIPTLLFFIGGYPRARLVGTTTKEAIAAAMQRTLSSGALDSPNRKSVRSHHEHQDL